ncbi:MAG: sugar ABC transporter permease [Clostridiales bacterium]|nr:sugar ABC transporter permease [Clostridiales bacterium]MDO4350600.1 sugar ABC transporter permease [Eubacteriales bacterium]MDY4007900.1 sugar ABC transporter permease [Candidatus Limiplasma sp.]
MNGAMCKTKRRDLNTWLNSGNVAGYVFISPWLIGFFLLSFIPIVISLYLSFTNYNLIAAPKFIGLRNFERMLSDVRLGKSINATLLYVFVSVPLKVGFALIVAFLMNHKMRGANFFRSAYYLPTLVGGGIPVALMWKQLFANEGVINGLLRKIGLEGNISWLGNKNTAIWTLILLTVWQFGSSMLIFSAGLKQIPETYYEAGRLDGASGKDLFIHITLPSLSSIIFFNLIMQLISAFMAFTQAYVITNGGPLDSTMLYALYVYRKAMDYFDMGYACALSWVLMIIVSLITLVIFRSSSSWVYYESKEV